MTTNQTPADPSAYRTVCWRNVSGIVDHIAIHGPDGAALVVVEDDDAERLISLAMDEERGEPGMLPSQRAFAAAALRDLGIPILGEEDDDEGASEARIQNAMAFGLEPPEEAPHRDPQDEDAATHSDDDDDRIDWRDVPVLVLVADAEPSIAMAGEFCDANREEPGLEATVRALVDGREDWVRFGGGAAPEVLVTRMDEPMRQAEATGALRALIAKAEAFDALLDAARDLMRDWDSPDLNDASPIAEKFAALRAAIAKAEGR